MPAASQRQSMPNIANAEDPIHMSENHRKLLQNLWKALRASDRYTSRSRRVLARGVTLVEILIVLAIIAMIAGGVAVVAVPKLEDARVQTTRTNLRTLLPAAEMYRSNFAGECPTVQLLQQKKEISSTSETKDPWGKPYKIICEEDDTRVVSFGKDGKENTPDDIVMPEQKTGE